MNEKLTEFLSIYTYIVHIRKLKQNIKAFDAHKPQLVYATEVSFYSKASKTFVAFQ